MANEANAAKHAAGLLRACGEYEKMKQRAAAIEEEREILFSEAITDFEVLYWARVEVELNCFERL